MYKQGELSTRPHTEPLLGPTGTPDRSPETPFQPQVESEHYKLNVGIYAHSVFKDTDEIEYAIAELWDPDHPLWQGTQAEIPTPDWHGTATDVRALIRTHVLRLVKGWKNETAVVTYFRERIGLAEAYGYDSIEDVSQSKLWRAWNKRYSETLKQAIEYTAEMLVETARFYGLPAPDDVFRPSEHTQPNASERTERELISKHTKEVWQQAKPFVEDSFYLHRGENAQIPEGAWWEQHTYMGMRSDMFAESGADSYHDDTTRKVAPRGRHHRDKLRVLDTDAVREMMRNTTQALVARARHNSELVGNLTVAIDITKGHPWTGDVDRAEDGQNEEEYILGYKGGELHYQWASIQVVGYDIPLVLDVMPVKRGDSRAELVDELLGNAKEIVGGIDLVMMDREFDSEGVKNACDSHDVYYLNPARKWETEQRVCAWMRGRGKPVYIKEQKSFNDTSRKQMFLPQTRADVDALEELGDETRVRREMRDDLAEQVGVEVDTGRDWSSPFSDVINEMRDGDQPEDDGETKVNVADEQRYTLFETNHPAVDVDQDASEVEEVHMVERMVRRYRHRWGIENGFKKIKTFMVRTASKNHQYRFFNFAFACVLYNVWRLVDLLVKLAIDGENSSYTPRLDANRFLTHAKNYYGLDPPD